MTAYFFDSSALVKRYVTETGTNWVRAITARSAGHIIYISQITSVETVSALARRNRTGSISARTARAARLLVDRHTVREYNMVRLSDDVAKRAEDLLEMYPLRASDAIQLASAIEANLRLLSGGLSALTFVCADTRLLTAASGEQLPTHNPI